ncbi:protein of unknown function [Hyphomicrobium sp. MC1]|nr:protein of unknown function [Hyphomicrobium sp. MC1]
MAFTFCAFLRIDDVHIALEADRGVRALELACSADCALRSDDLISHGSHSSGMTMHAGPHLNFLVFPFQAACQTLSI